MNWGDELCGVKVTPESWTGGIADWRGEWEVQESAIPEFAAGHHATFYKPIFPPRGWAGKTDAELWAAVFGDDMCDVWELKPDIQLYQDETGTLHILSEKRFGAPIHNPAPLILALQNAQVLAKRLQEAV